MMVPPTCVRHFVLPMPASLLMKQSAQDMLASSLPHVLCASTLSIPPMCPRAQPPAEVAAAAPAAAPVAAVSVAAPSASVPAPSTGATSSAATGGNAILARLRQQRAAPMEGGAATAAIEPSTTAAAASSAPAAAVAEAGVVVHVATAAAPPGKQDAATAAAPAPAAAAATGGNAILARLKQQRAAPPPPAVAATAGAKPPLTFAFASQTGTGAEIARNLAAEAVEKGYKAQCMSLTELGYAALTSGRTPYLVIVASSTGDGDPPDNSGAFFVALRKKQEGKPLVGVKFTLLGLGDSNYTRFMYVSRAIKGRLLDLGAAEFYPCAEADEVDGIESVVDPWSEGLWTALDADIAPQKDQAADQVRRARTFGHRGRVLGTGRKWTGDEWRVGWERCAPLRHRHT